MVDSGISEFVGLSDCDTGMVCTVCQKIKLIAGPSTFLTGNSSYRIDSIRSHFASPKHLQCEAAYQAGQRRAANKCAGPMDDVLRRIGEKKLLLCSLFNTAYSVLQSEMPFTVYLTLLKLQIKNCSDL